MGFDSVVSVAQDAPTLLGPLATGPSGSSGSGRENGASPSLTEPDRPCERLTPISFSFPRHVLEPPMAGAIGVPVVREERKLFRVEGVPPGTLERAVALVEGNHQRRGAGGEPM